MGNRSKEILFIDNLDFSVFVLLVSKGFPRDIYLLDKASRHQAIFIFLLNIIGYRIREADFFAGNLKAKNGESVFLNSLNCSRRIAIEAALEIVETNKYLNEINNYFGKNTLLLHLTKQLIPYLQYYSQRILVSENLALNHSFQVILRYPDRINPQVLLDSFKNINILFCKTPFYNICSTFTKYKVLYIELFRFYFFPFYFKGKGNSQIARNSKYPSVLTLNEDTLRTDFSFRGQPHWFEFDKSLKKFNTYILRSVRDGSILSEEISNQFKENRISVIDASQFRMAHKQMKFHDGLVFVRKYKKSLFFKYFFSSSYKSKYSIIKTALLLKQAEHLGVISLWLNVKIFLFRESYPYTDAIQLVNKPLGVKTIAYQYSNLGVVSPIMMNTADRMIIFSESFKNIFKNNFFTPKNFVVGGYVYKKLNEAGRKRAYEFRRQLQLCGASFIISYFDESVSISKWGLVSESDHLHELHILSNFVIDNDDVAVVIKSQFQRYTPSKLYPNDPILSRAFATGRFLELHKGSSIRNDILPAESGLISDISIGHKFGATASLEVAIEGVRSVMIDQYGTKTIWDQYYNNKNITLPNIEAIISAINQFRKGNPDYYDFGNWSSFLDIITNCNFTTVDKIQKIIESEFAIYEY
jgi:hypothetical protein